jgi:mercuric ion transport protein
MAKSGKLIGIGGVGAMLAAICCFTPALVLLLGALGLSALVGWWLDLILFPAMAISMGIILYGLYLRWRIGVGIAAGTDDD